MFSRFLFHAPRSLKKTGKRNIFNPQHYRPLLSNVVGTILNIESGVQFSVNESGFIKAEKDNVPCIQAPDLPAYEIVPIDSLYGISEKNWEKFNDALDQEILKSLGLLENRHLWPGYNLALAQSSREHQLRIAERIGNMHFLMDMLLRKKSYLTSLEIYQKAPSEEKKQLRKNFVNLLRVVRNGNKEDFYDAMQALHPAFPLILDKVKRRPNFDDVARLVSHLSSFAFDGQSLDLEKLHRAIDLIPSSSIGTILALMQKIGTNHSGLFFNGHNKWERHTLNNTREINETHFMRYLENLYSDLGINTLQHFSREEFFEFIKNSCAILKLHNLQKEWHSQREIMRDQKPFLTQEGLYQIYRNSGLLPLRLQEDTHEEMLKNLYTYMGNEIDPAGGLKFS